MLSKTVTQAMGYGYDRLNSSVFSLSVNTPSEGADLTCAERLFQASGAAAEKPRSPNFNRVLGRLMFKPSAERKRLAEVLSDNRTTSSHRYFGAQP